jgi:hypothetical protein
VSEEHLDWLKEHQPSLLISPLPWSVYLERDPWRVTKLMDLHDALYWDPAFDLAMLQNPPFRQGPGPASWAAFVQGYGQAPDEKRLHLYLLMQRIDAALGNYMAPGDVHDETWARVETCALDNILDFLGQNLVG